MKVRFKKLHENVVLPKKATAGDACYDVIATSKVDLGDGRIVYGLGFALQPEDLESNIQLDLRARSSIHKTGMILSNCIGTGDKTYTGEYKAVFYKVIPTLPDYEVGDRILQIQLQDHIPMEFEETDTLENTDRGTGGYGSTGL